MSTRTSGDTAVAASTEVLTYRQAVNAALTDAMTEDPDVLLLGEDVGTEGGVFKTNHGLADTFGPERVLNTPICENGFTGVALGLAVMGMRPVVEVMFADFLPTAADALVNQLPKYRFMSGGQASAPVTVRAICGGGGRYGCQHSATGESWYIGLPGLRVCAASSPGAAYGLLRAAIADSNPVLVYEHKALLGSKGPVVRGEAADPGRAEIVRPGTDVTLVGTMLMVHRALKAASLLEAEGISVEVVDLRWLNPLDHATVLESVSRTKRLLIVEEQVHAGGWGSTIVSRLAQESVDLVAPPRVVGLPDSLPMPFSPSLEDELLPSEDSISAAVKSMLARA